jgi:putative ABC transport system permease protein
MAFRLLKRDKISGFINIVGLAIGMASFMFIFLFVQDEMAYDTLYKKADRLYRITYQADGNEPWLKDMPTVAPGIAANIPEIESYTRVLP